MTLTASRHADPRHARIHWPYRVLTVDSPTCPITHTAHTVLLRHGIDLRPFSDAAGALLGLQAEDPAAVLAPTDMKGVDFLVFVRAVTSWSDAAVLVGLTPGSESPRMAVEALDLGAHGLLGLPFEHTQLASALHNLGLRRIGRADTVRYGPISLDRAAHLITVAGAALALSPKELHLLECLLTEAPRVVPTAELVEALGAGPDGQIPRAVRTYVRRLRCKLDALYPSKPPCRIENVRALGYRLIVDPDPD